MGKKKSSVSESHSASSEVELNENDNSAEVEESTENMSSSVPGKKIKKGKKRSLAGDSEPSSEEQSDGNKCLEEAGETFKSEPIFKKAKNGKERNHDDTQDENENSEKMEEDNEAQSVEKIKKPLPPGYVCKACGKVDDHAIYDCTLKVSKTKKGNASKQTVNSKDNNDQGDGQQQDDDENVSASYSLFVSGLPFETNKHEFLKFLQSSVSQSKQQDEVDDEKNTEVTTVTLSTRDIILLNFTDNPSKCNGLGYINCANEEDFQKILGLNGMKYGKLKLSIVPSSQPKKSKKDLAADFSKRANKKKGKEEGQKRCYRCGQLHDPKTCPNPRICYRCRQNDHISSDCPLKKVK
jgi:hypothetical protein